MTPDPKAWFSRLVLSVPLSHRYDTSGKIVRETKVVIEPEAASHSLKD